MIGLEFRVQQFALKQEEVRYNNLCFVIRIQKRIVLTLFYLELFCKGKDNWAQVLVFGDNCLNFVTLRKKEP
tara:strand:+ start:46822 stop:47037 length:216 start_codon:yes stop_codon:yes gene_type:complete